MFNKAILGTRDIQNILKKRGIKRSLSNIIINEKLNKDILKPNRLKQWKYKGIFRNLTEISEMENINKDKLYNRIYNKKETLLEAINYCKSFPTEIKLYPFRGTEMTTFDIIKLIIKETGLKEYAAINRFYRRKNDNFEELFTFKSTNKYAPYPKKITAEKKGVKQEFNSIIEAGRCLNINSPSNISSYLNKKTKYKPGGYHFEYL